MRETTAQEKPQVDLNKERQQWEEKASLERKIQELEQGLKDKDTKIVLLKEKLQTTLLETELSAHNSHSAQDKLKFLHEEANHYSVRYTSYFSCSLRFFPPLYPRFFHLTQDLR
jgi:predicted  nucleic acid-binding Zn-ribbon protein